MNNPLTKRQPVDAPFCLGYSFQIFVGPWTHLCQRFEFGFQTAFVYFIYFFCSFFLCSHELSTPGDDACHKWPSRLKHHFSWENCFERGCLLVKGLFMSFLSKERIMAQKCSREMGNFLFGQRAPRHQSRMILKYYGPGTCVFGYRKWVGRLEAIASLDAYQIIKYQVL